MKLFLFLILISLFSQDDLEKAYLESPNKTKKSSSGKEKLKAKSNKKQDTNLEKKNSEAKINKSYWLNPSFIKNSNYIPGLEKEVEKVSVTSPTKEAPSKIIETPKTAETKTEPKKPNPFFSIISDNLKIILIISSIILFGIWRFFKPANSERTTRVYSKFRNKN